MRTTIILPDEIEEQIRNILEKKNKSFSSLIRDFLVSYIEENKSFLNESYSKSGFSDKQKEELRGLIKEVLSSQNIRLNEIKSSKEVIKSEKEQLPNKKDDLELAVKQNLENDRKETDSKEGEEKYRAAHAEWNSLTTTKRSYPKLFDEERFKYITSLMNQFEKDKKIKEISRGIKDDLNLKLEQKLKKFIIESNKAKGIDKYLLAQEELGFYDSLKEKDDKGNMALPKEVSSRYFCLTKMDKNGDMILDRNL